MWGRRVVLFGVLTVGWVVGSAHANEMAKARRLLVSRKLGDRLRGLEMLARLDSAQSVGALTDTIRRAARELDKLEPKLDKVDDEWTKYFLYCRYCEINGYTRNEQYREWRRARDRKEAEYRKMAAEVNGRLGMILRSGELLVELRAEDAIERLEQQTKRAPNALMRQMYLAGLEGPSRKRSVPLLIELLGHKDLRVRAGAIRSLRPFAHREDVQAAILPLAEDRHWAVRLGAYQVMGHAPMAFGVPNLVKGAARETGEIAFAVDSYLFHHTGRSFRQDPNHWIAWWRAHGDSVLDGTYAPGAADLIKDTRKEKTVSAFFKIPIESRRIVFALDFSASMSEEIQIEDKDLLQYVYRYNLSSTYLGYAQAEFIRALLALPEDAMFDIVGYSSETKTFASKLVKATKSQKKRAVRWVKNLEVDALTNIYGALEASFRAYLSGGSGRARALPDTIVFLTDGHATRGRFRESDTLGRLVNLWNRPLDVVIHTVGIGKDHDKKLLATLARETGGYYVDVSKGVRDLKPRRRHLPGIVGDAGPGKLKPAPKDELSQRLENEDETVRLAALSKLGKEPANRIRPRAGRLGKMFADDNSAVREMAIQVMAKLGQYAVPALKKAIESDVEDEFLGACECVPLLGKAATGLVEILAKVATYEERGEYAVEALGKLGPLAKDAIPALEKAAESSDWTLSEAAKEALRKVRGES